MYVGLVAPSPLPWNGSSVADLKNAVEKRRKPSGTQMIFFLLIFQLPSVIGQHSFSWEGMWREVTELSKNASFAVREQAGHSLKSSLKVITCFSSSRVTGAGFFHTTFIFTIMCLGCLQSATKLVETLCPKGPVSENKAFPSLPTPCNVVPLFQLPVENNKHPTLQFTKNKIEPIICLHFFQHTVVMDKRDNLTLPTEGYFLKLSQVCAMLIYFLRFSNM